MGAARQSVLLSSTIRSPTCWLCSHVEMDDSMLVLGLSRKRSMANFRRSWCVGIQDTVRLLLKLP
jgi:hypothetical protein